jgi:hypothetical protein
MFKPEFLSGHEGKLSSNLSYAKPKILKMLWLPKVQNLIDHSIKKNRKEKNLIDQPPDVIHSTV